MDAVDKEGISMNTEFWTGHLDVMIFIILFYPVAVEYFMWRMMK